MSTPDATPDLPSTPILSNPKVRAAIIVIGAIVLLVIDDTSSRSFNASYLLGMVIGMVIICLLIAGVVYLICWVLRRRLTADQFWNLFFGLYGGFALLRVLTAWLRTMT
jgi:hypothetical protein